MTDTTASAAAPPKKRFGFKKAAWQTAPKAEGQDDLFSHAKEFPDIVAEETKRKNEEKKKKLEEERRKLEEERRKLEEANKRKADEERARKKRKLSVELEESVRRSSLESPASRTRMASKGRSKTPMSPIRSPIRSGAATGSLARQYDTLLGAAAKKSEVIDLGSSDGDEDDDDDDDISYRPSPVPSKRLPIHSRRAPSEEVEEVDDPIFAALKAKARARAAARTAGKEQTPPTVSTTPKPATTRAVVQLLITSEIPNTKPLLVKVKADSALEKPKAAWCEKQGFSEDKMRAVFMTWKNNRIYDSTMIRRLGVQEDEHGLVTVDGEPPIYDEIGQERLPKIHVDAWTEEVFQRRKREDAAEAAGAARAAEASPLSEGCHPNSEPEAESEEKRVRLTLKAKGKKDFKIIVRRTTDFGHLMKAYKQNYDIPEDQPITLMFDGERLKPIDTVEDTEIDDEDALEVHFK